MNYRNFNFNDTNYIITHTRQTYHRTTSGKGWKSKPTKEYNEIVTNEFYNNFVISIPFFNNLGTCRAKHHYTEAGYLPTIITSISPYNEIKHIDTFSFEYVPMYKMRSEAGWRENDVIDNVKSYNIYKDGEHKLIELLHKDNEHTAVFDLTFGKWVN